MCYLLKRSLHQIFWKHVSMDKEGHIQWLQNSIRHPLLGAVSPKILCTKHVRREGARCIISGWG